MRVQDILISVIVLSLTLLTILLQYNLIKIYTLKYETVPLELLVLADEIRMEKLLYSQYLSSGDPNYMFYFDSRIKDSIIEENLSCKHCPRSIYHYQERFFDGVVDILHTCAENCTIKKYFSISCGELVSINVSNIDKNRQKITIEVSKYKICFAPVFIIEEVSFYFDKKESKRYTLSIYDSYSIIRNVRPLLIIQNYTRLIEILNMIGKNRLLIVRTPLAILVPNAKFPVLLTDKYGRLYKIYPVSIKLLTSIERSTKEYP